MRALCVLSGHEASTAAADEGVLDDKVFEDLLKVIAAVDGAIDERRVVMQDVGGTRVVARKSLIYMEVGPEQRKLRIPLHGTGPLLKRRLRQVLPRIMLDGVLFLMVCARA